MTLNFPSNPNNNDTYTSNGTTWQYDGVAWTVIPADSLGYPNNFGSIFVSGSGSISSNNSSDTLNLISGNNITIIADAQTNTVSISSNIPEDFALIVAADDSTQRSVSIGESIKFIGGPGIDTSSDAEGNITITSTASSATFGGLSDVETASLTIDQIYEQAIVRFTMDNVGTTAYTFSPHYSGNNPNVYLISGTTVAFNLAGISSLPFEIQAPTGEQFNTGLVHVATNGTISTGVNAQGKSSGTLYWRIPESISGTYRYECQLFPAMFGTFTIKRLSLI